MYSEYLLLQGSTIIDRVTVKNIKLAESYFNMQGWFINAVIYCPDSSEKLEYNWGD